MLNADDRSYHHKAREANRVNRPVLTSAWILLELADHLCDERNRRLYRMVMDALHDDPRYEIVPADQATLDQASDLYFNRPDKAWSLTDCTSLILMRQRGLAEALTADKHFEQAGFSASLK